MFKPTTEYIREELIIYLIGSLRNPEIPVIGEYLRKELDCEVFDEWWTASEDADDWLRDYFRFRKLGYKEAIHSYAARHIFEFDRYHLNRATMGVLVMPAGKSGHLELGYLIGQGKPGFILFDREPERVDIMHNFANDVFFDKQELINGIKGLLSGADVGSAQVQLSQVFSGGGFVTGEGSYGLQSSGRGFKDMEDLRRRQKEG